MWPLSTMGKVREDRSFRQSCLDEIVDSAYQIGIEFTDFFLTTDDPIRRRTNLTNVPIKELEELKRSGIEYSIEFFVQEAEMGDDGGISGHSGVGIFRQGCIIPKMTLPEGYFEKPIGQTRNPNYDSEKATFYEGVKLVGIQLRDKYQRLFEQDTVAWRQSLEEWEKIPNVEWERRNRENQEVCPYCVGSTVVPTGTYKLTLSDPTSQLGEELASCTSCHEGKIDAPTLRSYHKPHELDRKSLRYLPTDGERNKALQANGLKHPLEHFDVFIKITSKG